MRRRTAFLAAGLAAVVAAGAIVAVAVGGDPPVRQEVLSVPVSPDSAGRPVSLDATLYLPGGTRPAPAVVLAHGFGGTKADESGEALDLARDGYVVLTYTARGFGNSGGQVELDSPQYEVRDAETMINLLARQPEVLQDAPGDPRVGFSGQSYGGALSLLVAAYDKRVDAIVPEITWNDLQQSLFPQSAVASGSAGVAAASPADLTPETGAGVFKRGWSALFFGAGAAATATPVPTAPATTAATPVPGTCGRLGADVCAAYEASAMTGVATPQAVSLLAAASPAGVLNRIKAPTLLIQGENDSLFPLSQADANARGIAANGTPAKVVWYTGGHDGDPNADAAWTETETVSWFDRYLKHDGSAPDTRFEYALPGVSLTANGTTATTSVYSAPGYPGVGGTAAPTTAQVALAGSPQTVVSPAGGSPAAITTLPGIGILSELSGLGEIGTGLDPPGQDADFVSAPLPRTTWIVGAPTVSLRISSSTGDATLFAKLYDVAPDGSATLPEDLASPVRLTGLPTGPDGTADTTGTVVRVSLPAVVYQVAAGHRLRLVVSTTDQAYQLPTDARTYRVALDGDGGLTLPQVAAQPTGGGLSTPVLALIGAAALLVLLVAMAIAVRLRRRLRAPEAPDSEAAAVPLAVSGLGKAYGDGFRAVTDVSFQVGPGQVVGLLGPNGAGKTTTLRMAMGLIRPTEGEIRIFGHRVTSSAPVLSRVGCFVEGPGFLPHASGLDNLTLYWAATGRRAEDARMDAALELAGLGADVHRKVHTYSQGMRQRLAVAQAMLGLPDLLILDEPTNGLDPPQIREMREALRRYATTGRTVLVSSHLLAEVEQTCTHAVVMHRGRLIAHGPVSELVGAATAVALDVDEPARAVEVLTALPGVREVVGTPPAEGWGSVSVQLDGTPRAELVKALVGAGIGVDRVAPQNRLEDVFLSLVEES